MTTKLTVVEVIVRTGNHAVSVRGVCVCAGWYSRPVGVRHNVTHAK